MAVLSFINFSCLLKLLNFNSIYCVEYINGISIQLYTDKWEKNNTDMQQIYYLFLYHVLLIINFWYKMQGRGLDKRGAIPKIYYLLLYYVLLIINFWKKMQGRGLDKRGAIDRRHDKTGHTHKTHNSPFPLI